MSFKEMVEFLDLSYNAKDYIVPCLIGGVGIGKTAAVNQHAKNVGAKRVVEIIASQILPTEISGIKMPDNASMSMKVYDDARLSELEDGDILFFDELLEADQMVLSACLTLIENRTMLSGKKLPDIQIIAATNPTISPSVLKPSIRQRFLFKHIDSSFYEIRDYIFEKTGVKLIDAFNGRIKTEGDKYNILSPRSLTKAIDWYMSCNSQEERNRVQEHLNDIYDMFLGNMIKDSYDSSFNKSTLIMKNIFEIVDGTVDGGIAGIAEKEKVDVENIGLEELMDVLKHLPEWDKLAEQLEKTSAENFEKISD